jgi:tetratricopeptide (TPR) repeat protein
MATFFLKHEGLGKARYDRQGAVAHAGYILRKGALLTHGTRHMPEAYNQILGWAGRVYDQSRKNARVYDKLILNLPRELNTAEHVTLLRQFLDELTLGRTPYLFAIHMDRPGNPHAHVIIRDADIETGKRVAGLSKAGSSYKVRAIWERINNQALTAYKVAISRWGKHSAHHQELNATAQRGPTVHAYETILEAQAELAELRNNAVQLKKAQQETEQVKAQIEQHTKAIDTSKKALELASRANDHAIQELEPHKMWLLFAPVLGRLGLYRRRIEQARLAQIRANAAQATARTLANNIEDDLRTIGRKEIYLKMLAKDVELYQNRLAMYGNHHDQVAKHAELVAVIQHNVARIDPEKLNWEQKRKVAQITMSL